VLTSFIFVERPSAYDSVCNIVRGKCNPKIKFH